MAEQTPPIVLDLGKRKKKQLKALKRGQGKLMAEVLEAIAQLKEELGDELGGKDLLPVVVLYKEKESRSRSPFPMMPFLK